MHIFYLGYPLRNEDAPHQAMAAFWFAWYKVKVTFMGWGQSTTPATFKNYAFMTYRPVPKTGILSAFVFFGKVFVRIYRSKPDIVYVQGAQQTPFVFWIPFLRFFVCKGTSKIVYHTQDYLEPGQHKLYEVFERFFSKHADLVISNEPNRARFMTSHYRLKKAPKIIRTALPSWWSIPKRDECFRQELLEKAGLRGAENPRLIVAGGAYRADRMSPEVVQSLANLPGNYALIFNYMPLGSSCRSNCERHLKELGIEKRFVFLSPLPYDEILKLYAACDIGILLYPNNSVGHFYQAPGRLTEYLRCGLPIVTSEFPGLELLTMKYDLGIVADPYDSTDIAEAICSLGKASDEQMILRRERLINCAETELAYDEQAKKVFQYIL